MLFWLLYWNSLNPSTHKIYEKYLASNIGKEVSEHTEGDERSLIVASLQHNKIHDNVGEMIKESRLAEASSYLQNILIHAEALWENGFEL